MLGMGDWSVALAYWLNIVAVVICVVYGAIDWMRGIDHFEDDTDQESPS